MKRRRGFTLIELLVVMVIIMILAGILYPVFASMKSKTRQVKCSSQMRQIGMAIQMYAADHDDFPPIGGYDTNYLPSGFNYPPGPVNSVTTTGQQQLWRVDWEDALFNGAYLKSYDILVCPSAQSTDYRYSYGVNRWVMGWRASLRLDLVDQPANTLLLTEKTGTDWVAWEPTARANNPYYRPLEVRHLNQLNILFCDGHVGHVGYGELIEGGTLRWRP